MSQNKKLYVGSLPYSVTEDELNQLFSQFGTVESVRIITDKFTGQSKGFGFVEMSSDEEAKKATELNGTVLKGRTLIVNEARPEERRERAPSGGGGFRGDRNGRRSH